MDLGIVSNCWRTQLEAGVSLEDLIAEAVRRDFRTVELRQGCLGAYESGSEAVPDAEALARLAGRFPELRFNLALALPFFGGGVTPDLPLFGSGLRAAQALSGAAAHLRLVDPATPPEAVTDARREAFTDQLAALAAACAEAGAKLSIENARQPWQVLLSLFRGARERLGDRAEALGLCYDPCNLLGAADRPDPPAETPRLRAEEIALFHFKQSRDGAPHPEVGPGEIDWPAQLAALGQIGYEGPRLFEIPPGSDIWERLEHSRDYLNTIERG